MIESVHKNVKTVVIKLKKQSINEWGTMSNGIELRNNVKWNSISVIGVQLQLWRTKSVLLITNYVENSLKGHEYTNNDHLPHVKYNNSCNKWGVM